jgi:nucleoside-diphosphate-sugar epimerase
MKQRSESMMATQSTNTAENSERAARTLAVFGAGYMGGALARRALVSGWRVVALTRNVETAAELRAAGAEVVVAEIGSVSWREAPELAGGAGRVAVTVSAGGGGVEGYRRSYVEGLKRVAEWGGAVRARGGLAGRLVYTSSTSVYPQDGGVNVTEAEPVGGAAETTQALIEAERLAGEWPGAGATILRLAGIYGPGRMHIVEQVRSGEVSGRPEAHLNLVHRDDILAALEAAFAAGAAGTAEAEGMNTVGSGRVDVFNIADEGAATKGEIVAWLAGRLGVQAPTFTGLPAGGRRAVTPNRIIDAAKARDRLGWRLGYPTYREGYFAILEEQFR